MNLYSLEDNFSLATLELNSFNFLVELNGVSPIKLKHLIFELDALDLI